MPILNSLPTKIGLATTSSNGLMSASDKIAINKINRIGTKLILTNGIEEDIVFVVSEKEE